jgi:hypothetical protein
MVDSDLKNLVKQELTSLLQEDGEVQDLIMRTASGHFAAKPETESRFDQIMAELKRDREEQRRRWDENQRRWEENQQRLENIYEEIRAMNRKHESTIGALGARWGLYSEGSFRNALKGILEDSFGVEVVNLVEYDDAGEVFGRPEQIELDVIIKNGELILCEIKSSISKSELYAFLRKTEFYERRHQRQATRKIVISPMVHPKAQPIGPRLGIEIYSYAEDVPMHQVSE